MGSNPTIRSRVFGEHFNVEIHPRDCLVCPNLPVTPTKIYRAHKDRRHPTAELVTGSAMIRDALPPQEKDTAMDNTSLGISTNVLDVIIDGDIDSKISEVGDQHDQEIIITNKDQIHKTSTEYFEDASGCKDDCNYRNTDT